MVKIMENPIKMDELGVPLFLETPKSNKIFPALIKRCHCLGEVFPELGRLCLCDLYFGGREEQSDVGVSKNRGVSPQIIHFNRVFHYKPCFFGVPLFLETPMWGFGVG